MATEDKAWSLLESSASLFRMIAWLANTVKDLVGQPRLLSQKCKTLCDQVPAQLTILTVQSHLVSVGIHL